MNYFGYGKLQSSDVRWNMKKNGITREQMANATGIPLRKLEDMLSLYHVPDKYSEVLMDAIIDIKKNRKRRAKP